MIQTKTREIQGHSIEVVQFPARRAFKYQIKLFKLLAPLAEMIGSVKQSGLSTSDIDTSIIDKEINFSGFNSFASALDNDETMNFVMTLLSSTRIDNKEITDLVFDSEFAGDIVLVYKILLFVLEVNYGSFFGAGGIGKILTGLKNPILPKSE